MPLLVENDRAEPALRAAPTANTAAPDAATRKRPAKWQLTLSGALVTGTSLALFGWGLTGAGPWRDEVVTVEVATRSWSGIAAVVGDVDLVHAAYYALVRLATAVLPGAAPPLTIARSLSAVAMAATVWALIRLTARLAWQGPAHSRSSVVSLTAGATLALSVGASRYAQEARPFALATALATWSTLALVTALVTAPTRGDITGEDGAGRPGLRPVTRRWVGYGVLVVCTGLVNVLALLVLAPHAMIVVLYRRRAWLAWLLTTACALSALAPFLVAAFGQREQLSWRPHAPSEALFATAGLAWPPHTLTVGLIALTLALVLAELGRRAVVGPSAGTPVVDLKLATVGLSWALLPPVLLWLVGRHSSLYDTRYLVPCLPGAALAVASCLTAGAPRAGRRWSVAATAVLLVALVATGMASQRAIRGPVGHEEDVRGVAVSLGRQAQPGDAVLFRPSGLRLIGVAYPALLANLDDVSLAVPGRIDGTLTGGEKSSAEVARALRDVNRLWLVTGTAPPFDGPWVADPALQDALAPFSLTRVLPVTSWHVALLERAA